MARRNGKEAKEPRRVARADELYGLPLDQFTAARDRLAKSLRAAGDREAAEQVRKLRKPTTTVWAVNQLVRRFPREAAGFFKAADRLRAAQRGALGPRGGEGLRAASEEVRSQIAELVAAAREVLREAGTRADVKALEAVREILLAAPTAAQGERRLLERGTLTEPLRPAAFSDVLAMMRGARGGLRLVPPPEEEEKEKKKGKSRREPTEAERAARRAAEEERARRLSAERERALARRETKRAEEESRAQRLLEARERARQAEARRARDAARRTAERAAKAAERAEATAERAAAAAERAEEAARRARGQADAAEEAADEARARVAEAEQQLAEAEAELVEVEDARPARAGGRGR
jgi:hypothetical protein